MPNLQFVDPGPTSFGSALNGMMQIGFAIDQFKQNALKNQLLKLQGTQMEIENELGRVRIEGAKLGLKREDLGYMKDVYEFENLGEDRWLKKQAVESELAARQSNIQTDQLQQTRLNQEIQEHADTNPLRVAMAKLGIETGQVDLEGKKLEQQQLKSMFDAMPTLAEEMIKSSQNGYNLDPRFVRQMATAVGPKLGAGILDMIQHTDRMRHENAQLQAQQMYRTQQQQLMGTRDFYIGLRNVKSEAQLDGLAVLAKGDPQREEAVSAFRKAFQPNAKVTRNDIISTWAKNLMDAGDTQGAMRLLLPQLEGETEQVTTFKDGVVSQKEVETKESKERMADLAKKASGGGAALKQERIADPGILMGRPAGNYPVAENEAELALVPAGTEVFYRPLNRLMMRGGK